LLANETGLNEIFVPDEPFVDGGATFKDVRAPRDFVVDADGYEELFDTERFDYLQEGFSYTLNVGANADYLLSLYFIEPSLVRLVAACLMLR